MPPIIVQSLLRRMRVMSNTDLLTQVQEDVQHLVDWTHLHDEEHVTEAKRMNLVLLLLANRERDQSEHDSNHHGTATKVKRDGLIVLAVSLVYALTELLRSGLLPF